MARCLTDEWNAGRSNAINLTVLPNTGGTTLCSDDLCEPFPLGMPRGLRLDALPLFVRNLRSRSSSGIYDPALRPGFSTGVLHHVRICKAKGRDGSVAGGVEEEEVEVVGNVPDHTWMPNRRQTPVTLPP